MKSIKFEVGKWYFFIQEDGRNWILHCSGYEGNSLSHFYCFTIKGEKIADEYSHNGIWGNTSDIKEESIREVSIEEIQKYFPEGHVYKIKEPIFNVFL